MKKVTKLKVVNPRRVGKARPEDIKIVHQILTDLESGKVQEIAVVGLHKDGSMSRAWSAPRHVGNAFRMIGSIEKLREEYMRKQIEE